MMDGLTPNNVGLLQAASHYEVLISLYQLPNWYSQTQCQGQLNNSILISFLLLTFGTHVNMMYATLPDCHTAALCYAL